MMTGQGDLICWNCLQRTPPGNCIHCDAGLSNPDEAFEEKKEENKAAERILEIRRRDQDNIRINLEKVIEIVEEHFTIKRMLYGSGPQFVVENPGTNLPAQFDQLIVSSEELVLGFKPMVERYSKAEEDELLIKYVYNDPPASQEYRIIVLLGLFTIISVFLSGLFNYTQLQNALGTGDQFRIPIVEIVLTGQSLLSALLFTLVMVVIIAIKDSIQIRSMLQNFKNKVTPFYIPAPPIFELGTFGSINKQDNIHKTREEMFTTTFIGPIIAWIVSVVILFFSLPLSSLDPNSAASYADHSVIASGSFEPIILTVLARVSNGIGLTSLDLSQPLTTQYLLHPITLAALGGFYITTFSLFPAAHFNGGFVIRSLLGRKPHWIFTYLTIAAVYFINWMLAVLLFFIHELLKTPVILNEETPPKHHYKYLLIPYFLILLVSYPFQIEILSTILDIIF